MEFKKKYGFTNTHSIEEFEAQFNILLSLDYKEFLKNENGGIPLKKTFLINNKQGYDTIDIFFGLDMEKPFLSLSYLIESYFDRFPKGILPIGEDPGGNYICLNVNEGEDYGKIYFYDHEVDNENNDGTLNWDNLYLIADSFTEFIAKLH